MISFAKSLNDFRILGRCEARTIEDWITKATVFRFRSPIFEVVAYLVYSLLVVAIFSGIGETEFVTAVIFMPLILSVFLQNTVVLKENKVCFFNKVFSYDEIKNIKIRNSMFNSYVMTVHTGINDIPKYIMVSHKYLDNLIVELKASGLKVEAKI